MTQSATDATHHRWSAQYREHRGMRFWPSEALVRFVGQYYGLTGTRATHPASVLELGCGNGANLWFLARTFQRVHGMDFSPDAIDQCRRLLAETESKPVRLAVGSVTDLRHYGEHEFDLIVDVQCLQHVTFHDHAVVYRDVARMLKPGGRFFSYHLAKGTVGYRRMYPDCGPVALLEKKWVYTALERVGMQVEITTELRTQPKVECGARCLYFVIDAQLPEAS